MKRENKAIMRVTREEMNLIMMDREKRKRKYIKRQRRNKLLKRIYSKVCSMQNLIGFGCLMGGMITYRLSTVGPIVDGEIAFTGVMLMLLGFSTFFVKEYEF